MKWHKIDTFRQQKISKDLNKGNGFILELSLLGRKVKEGLIWGG